MDESGKRSIRRYAGFYSKLLRLYPSRFRGSFGESMQQAFNDLCRERLSSGRPLSSLVLWLFFETSTGIFREGLMHMTTHHKRLVSILSVIAFLLMLPLLAMRFTDEVTWTLFDFAVAGVLLLAAGLTYEFFARRGGSIAARVTVGTLIATVLLVIWLELAVGLFGSPWAGS